MVSLRIYGRVLLRLLVFMGTTHILKEIDGGSYAGGPVNGRFLKHYTC